MLDINKNENITIFITSHLLKDIEVMCNKVCIIKKGKLIEQGGIQELQNKYMTHYTVLLQTSDNNRAINLLKAIKGIAGVEIVDEKVEVSFEKDMSESKINETKHEILSLLFGNEIDMKEMSTKSLSMEEIFFKATEGGIDIE